MRLPGMQKYMDIYPDKSSPIGLEYSAILALIFGDTYSIETLFLESLLTVLSQRANS